MLTGKQRRFLKALGIALDPILQIGKSGVSEMVVNSLEEALAARELVKVKVLNNCPQEPKFVGEEMAKLTDAYLVQKIGRNLIFYRRSKDKPSIELPR
ncbi:RNA-binding protein [Desulfonispora thiosulfatigenes DSM 11270]|uniref:RNA-binding protein n=1 Tax=Desulfonispora thiosulfatigenes DSM 11270 TaxID=656914 RepID=A0A1W1UH24_DESTI|nr:ribosome assembly RNA-binding protein YhbY [Desulfonispora thiosulfatigenes]SMB80339.1 RNA-binding protein [Desulfonispora thiosulfatigenes DSM 11270]